jgi:hypothetical protein
MRRSSVLVAVHGGLLVLLVAACLLAAVMFGTTVPPAVPPMQTRSLTDGDVLHLLDQGDPYTAQVLRDIYHIYRRRGQDVPTAYHSTLEAWWQARTATTPPRARPL